MGEERRLAVGYVKSLGGLLIMQAVQIGSAAVIARIFPTVEAFGRFSLVQQVLGLAGLFLGLGLDKALIVHLSREGRGEGAARRFSIAYRFTLWYGAVLMGLLILLARPIARLYAVPALAGDLIAAAPGLLGASLLLLVQGVQMGWGLFGMQALLTISYQVAGAGALVAGVLLLPSAPGVGAFALAAVVGLVVAGVALMRVARDGRFSLGLLGEWSEFRTMAAYGVPYWVGDLFKAYQPSFIIMLTGLVSVAEVGYLGNAWRLAGFTNVITWGFMIVSLPFISAVTGVADQRRRTRLNMRYNHYLLFPACVGLALYGGELVRWLFGEAYAPAARYLPPLAAGVLLSGVGRLASQCLAAVGETRATAMILTLPGVLVLAGGPVLIPRGVVLGPWLFLVGWLMAAALSLWLLRGHGLGLDWRVDFGRPVVSTVVVIAGALAGRWAGWVWLHLGLAVAGLLLGAGLVMRWERPGHAK